MMIILKIILFILLGLIALMAIGIAYLSYLDGHPRIPRVRAQGIRVACVGDSITQGMGVAFDHPERNSYPAQLEALLGKDYQVLNYGHSGRTLLRSGDKPYVNSVLFPASQAVQPAIVLIMLGTNDSKPHNWNAEEYEKQLAEFVEKYKNLPGKPGVFLLTPCAAFKRPGKKEVVYAISDAVIEKEIVPIVWRVARLQNMPVIDIYSATRDHPEYFGDGVHPNAKGDHAIARTVIAALK